MSTWTVSTACDIELGEFARRRKKTIEVLPEAAQVVLDRVTDGEDSGGNLLLVAKADKFGSDSTGNTKPKRRDDGGTDVTVEVVVDRVSRIRTVAPRSRTQRDIDKTAVHELQHAADFSNQPEIEDERIEQLMDVEKQKYTEFNHALYRSFPIAGERMMALVDAFNSTPNGWYRAVLVGSVLIQPYRLIAKEDAIDDAYYWEQDPLEARAWAAEERVDEIIPGVSASPIALVDAE